MGFTVSLRNNVLNHVFRNTTYTPPTTVYAALNNGSSEVTGNGYVRQPITFNAPSNGEISNDDELRYPIASSSWGTVDNGAIYDAATGGNKLADVTFNESREVRENDQVIFGVGSYKVNIDPEG